MEPERWARVQQLCQAALERDENEQAAFLTSACGNDQDLRREVESLLAYQGQEENFLEMPAFAVAAEALAQDQSDHTVDTPRLIGRVLSDYRIVEKLAGGGMGDVYRATRADGTYDKQVAIKVIQGARSTDFLLARFRNERQILATLDHPNIARLLDGGTTEEGLPYLVMEYVPGLPIDKFCEDKNLDNGERLELLRTVCSAVQYAHQNLVIHRDLKPSNILVTADGVPKLLDFGIAKILDPEQDEDGLQKTVTVLNMMTPDYASPEQVRNEAVSTSSDVYSLGVILYLLLAGHGPYRVGSASPQELIKAICDTEPERPSAATRGVSKAETQRKSLAGDLDNIVLKALKKEPSRRYSSVEQFSEDLRRYLTGLPVLAHSDTLGYRSRKFIGRHKLGAAAAALLVFSLIGGLLTTLWQARIARAERARAERRFNDVRALANSLIFDIHDAIQDLPGATAARKTILDRAQQYLDSLAAEARNDPALLQELALAYSRLGSVLNNPRGANLGNSAKAIENYRKAVELAKESSTLQFGDLKIRRELAEIYTELSLAAQDPDEAKSARIEANGLLEPMAANPQDLASQADLARIQELNAAALTRQKDLNPALEAYEKSFVLYEGLARADPGNEQYRIDVSFAHKHLGSVLSVMGRLDEALVHYRQALTMDEAELASHPDNLHARFNITYTYSDTGFILRKHGDLEGALSYYRKALAIRSALASADPNDARAQDRLASTDAYIAGILGDEGNYLGSLEFFKKSSKIWESLALRDPANQGYRSNAADSRAYIGETYAAMAAAPGVSRAMQVNYCEKAMPLFEPSLSDYQRAKKEGKLGPGDLLELSEIQKAHDQCARLVIPAY